MRAGLRTVSAITVSLVVAACSGGSATPRPAASTGPTAVAICQAPSAVTATQVEASVSGNTWGPVSAAAGDVITWTNADAVPHKVALDDGSCEMVASITGDAPQSLIFNVPGSYPFHCTIHPGMKGTIVIS